MLKKFCKKIGTAALLLLLIIIFLTGCNSDNVEKVKKSKIIVDRFNDYVDREGNLHIIGIVKNEGIKNAGNILVTASLLDHEGEIIEEESANAIISILPPGESSPFDIVFEGEKVYETESYKFNVKWEDTSKKPLQGLKGENLKTKMEDDGGLYIMGEVSNNNDRPVNNVTVAVNFYDDEADLVFVTTQNISRIPANQKLPFYFKTYKTFENIQYAEIQVFAVDQ